MKKESFAKAWDWKAGHDETIWRNASDDAIWLGQKWRDRRRFLDFGCGLGRHSLYFANLGFEVLGFDLSPDAVKETEKAIMEKGFTGTFLQSDMHHVAFPDSCCDCLLAYHVCSHTTLEGINKVIGEIYRLLEKGGACYLDLCAEDCYMATEAGYPRVDECTVVPDSGEEEGIPHCCLDQERIIALFEPFSEVRIEKKAAVYENGKRFQGGGHYWIYAVK